MTTYTKKYVNGVLLTLTTADQTALAARDAANWGTDRTTATTTAMMTTTSATPAQKLARMLNASGLTIADLKAELTR